MYPELEPKLQESSSVAGPRFLELSFSGIRHIFQWAEERFQIKLDSQYKYIFT